MFYCAFLCVHSGVAVVLVGKGFVFLVSRGGWAALPCGAAGLSAVCDCGIS